MLTVTFLLKFALKRIPGTAKFGFNWIKYDPPSPKRLLYLVLAIIFHVIFIRTHCHVLLLNHMT